MQGIWHIKQQEGNRQTKKDKTHLRYIHVKILARYRCHWWFGQNLRIFCQLAHWYWYFLCWLAFLYSSGSSSSWNLPNFLQIPKEHKIISLVKNKWNAISLHFNKPVVFVSLALLLERNIPTSFCTLSQLDGFLKDRSPPMKRRT